MTGPAASILVVDDSASKRYVISSWLRRGGYHLTEAETGAAALERMQDTHIDLVVLDVRLPDMDGFAVCERIKANPAHAATPVIHVSAAAIEMVDRTQGLARGADAYLVEPIDPDELLATVHAILRYYRGRQHAERLAARLSVLAGLSLRLNEAKTASGILTEAAAGAAAVFQSPALVCAQDPDSGWLVGLCPGPDSDPTVMAWTPPLHLMPAPGAMDEISPNALPDAVRAMTNYLASAETFGNRPERTPAFVLVPSDSDDPSVLRLLGQSVAAAMETLRIFDVEHNVALTLQRSLLPRRLPHIPGFDLAKRYVPASDVAEVGGDFYEICELQEHLWVAVGDIGGHSLHAATIMAEVRHATRAFASEGHEPAEVINRLNAMMQQLVPNEIATMCLLRIELGTGRTVLANAGHPPPLLVADGQVTAVTSHGPLLGFRAAPARQDPVDLAPGSTLVLYTDGLVERRGEHIDRGIARLVTAVAELEADLDAFCDRLVHDVAEPHPSDDIAVVAIRRRRSRTH